MSVGIIEDDNGAVLYCNTADWAFGPLFSDGEKARQFLMWMPADPRKLSDGDLAKKHSEFMGLDHTACDQCGEPEFLCECRNVCSDCGGQLSHDEKDGTKTPMCIECQRNN